MQTARQGVLGGLKPLSHLRMQGLSARSGAATAALAQRRPASVRYSRGACVIRCAASFGAGSSEDPYKVLGIGRNADYKQLQRAYNNKRRDAKGNDEAMARIEAAYNSIFMSSLSSRVQGGMEVSKDVKFADKPKYFPWRPRRYLAERTYIMVIAGLQAAVLAWALASPATAGQQPVIASSMIASIANIYKQNMIYPPPAGPGASEDEKKQGFRNILRGTILAFMATFLGCFVAYTLPDMVAATVNRVLPYWFYEYETTILTVGTCISQLIMSAFFR